MCKIRYSSEAKTDLADIKEYVGEELRNPDAAFRIITHITKRIRKLSRFPEMGASLSSIVDMETNYRFLVCKNHLVFYRIEDTEIYIVRVLYGKRDYLTILFGEPAPDDEDES
jgi:addiction module RelE/StbE family toxin